PEALSLGLFGRPQLPHCGTLVLIAGVFTFRGVLSITSLRPFGRTCRKPSSRAFHNGQFFDRPEAGPPAPTDLGGRHRQAESWPTREQRLKGAHAFDACKLMAKAEMDAGSEGDVPVRSSLKVELFGMVVCLRVHIGCRHHGHDSVALFQPNSAKRNVLSHEARL